MEAPRKQIVIISLISTVLVTAIVLALWNPPFLALFLNNSEMPVSVTVSDFLKSDTNKELFRSKARLIIINEFYATELNNDRSIHIYLPPSYYDDTDKRYPVLYVHDGKSIFELSDWSKESLNMHTQTDKLISEGKIEEIIIVGIDNIGENRVGEYAHWDGVDQGKPVTGVGLLHEDFILNDVKPFIDENFRTLPGRENTALMGASIGGFSTFNIGFRHPDVFSKLAMQSPYLGWGDNKLYEMIGSGPYKDKLPLTIWIDVGSKEGDFVDMAAQGLFLLLNNGYNYGTELAAYEAPNGEHSEKFWSERIKSILIYFYGEIGKPEFVELFINDQISLSDPIIKHINAVATFDSDIKMTVLGSYDILNPEILTIDDFGGALYPMTEGVTEVTFTTPDGLTSRATITIVK